MVNNCKQCGVEIEFEPIAKLEHIRPTVCNTCHCLNEVAAIRQFEAAITRRANEFTPPIYRDTNPESLPKAELEKVLAWQYGPKGLILCGETRKGKTRCMWLLIRRLLLQGLTVECMTSGEFARQCAEVFAAGGEQPREWFDRITQADALFIDDLGKFKLTERVEAELFDIVEFFTSRGKPLMFTTNGSSATLANQMSADRGPAIIGRVREFCKCVQFK